MMSTVSKRFLRFSISAASLWDLMRRMGALFRSYRIMSSFGALVMSTLPSPVR